jgi:hypothetical protein
VYSAWAGVRGNRRESDGAPFRLGAVDCGLARTSQCRVRGAGRDGSAGVDVLRRGHWRPCHQHAHDQTDRDAVLKALRRRAASTAEEHHPTGGLGGAVAELAAVEHPPACAWSECRTCSRWWDLPWRCARSTA